MVNVKVQSNELFFVRVREPDEVKRHILESLKEVVELLHKFERLKQIRHEKLEKIHKLKDLVKEANKMLGGLKIKLPHTNLKAAVAESKPKKVPEKKNAKATEKKVPQKEITELQKLEAELSAIESKLKSLS